MKPRNEKTSPKVARIAGKVLRRLAERKCKGSVGADYFEEKIGDTCIWGICTVAELKALAASALTQTPNRTLDQIAAMTTAERRKFINKFNAYNPDKPRATFGSSLLKKGKRI